MKFMKLETPKLPQAAIAAFAQDAYGLSGSFTTLASERDLNFRITPATGAPVVFKISNAHEPRSMVDLEIAALEHIARTDPGLPVPRVVHARDGAAITGFQLPGGESHLVHVLSWLAGDIIADARLGESQLFDLGQMAARLGRSLRGFFHPAAGGRGLIWDNAESPGLLSFVHHLPAAEQSLAREVLEGFRDHTLPGLKRLRSQVIHGDVHSCNALVNAEGKVSGIIDFGDLVHGALIQDLSNLIADFLTRDGPNDAVIAALAAGYRSITALEDEELAALGRLIEVRLMQTPVINAARQADGVQLEGYLLDFGSRVLPVIAQLRAMGPDHVKRLVSGAASARAAANGDVSALFARRQRVMGSKPLLFYNPPIHMVRGEGVWLHDAQGRTYLDCYNNVPHVGHCHPRVADAIARQARKLNTNTRYLTDEAIEYAERLTATADPSLSAVIYVNSGSEANDIAWRMAKAWTGRSGGLCMDYAYHGITDAVDAFSPSNTPGNRLQPHMRALPPPDDYRGPHRRGEAGLAGKYVKLGAAAISDLGKTNWGVAAAMIDSAFMTNGMIEAPAGYVQGIAAAVREAGGLFIADEVQSGFGRMGSAMWGHQHHGVTPDFITIGKPAGNGHPVGIIMTRPEILDHFTKESFFFSTFGGNNVSCAAGLAVLDIIRDEDLIARAARTGAALKAGLKGLMAKHSLIGDVRGTGLALGIELVLDRVTLEPAKNEAKRLPGLVRDEGVLIGGEGILGNILKIRPPLAFKEEHVEIVVGAIDRAMARV